MLGCVCLFAQRGRAAFGSNYARRHLQAVGSWEQTIGAFFVGGLLTLPLLSVVPVPTQPAPVDYAYLVLLAGMCSALAYVLYFRLVAEVGATIAISVEFLVIVIAVIVGAVAAQRVPLARSTASAGRSSSSAAPWCWARPVPVVAAVGC